LTSKPPFPILFGRRIPNLICVSALPPFLSRTDALVSVCRPYEDEEAETVFIRLRWADNDGNAYCPHCGCTIVYSCRRPNGAPRWRCKACRKDFSVTSGTLFAFHKLPLRSYLLAIAIFCNEVKGKSMLAMSRDLGVQYKTSFVLAHKMREAMASELRGVTLAARDARRKSMAPILVATSSLRTASRIAAIVGYGRTSPASARPWS
jgi:transposase-like protein